MEHEEYLKTVQAVMGDDSPASRQNAQYIKWAYQSLLEAFLGGARTLTEDAIQETIPNILFRLAVDVDWIPYLDDNDDPLPDKVGDIEVSGWPVSKEIWDGFMRLLPVENFEDFINVRFELKKRDWKHPTPKERIQGFIGTKRHRSQARLAREMCTTPGYPYSEYAAIQFIKLRLKEPKGPQVPKSPGLRQAEVLVRLFMKEDPVKYAGLRPEDFFWQAV